MFKRLIAAAALALIAAPVAAQDTIKIGFILPMTGQQQSTGKQISAAIKLFQQQHGDTVAGKKVQPTNNALIPSWSTLDERLQNGAWHTVDRIHYGTPYQWGPNVLMYNTETFPTAPDSWNVVFEKQDLPDGKSNEGRVQAYDGAIYIADAALYLMSAKPELGIKDPYELNETQYAAVLELLKAQRALVSRYWHDAAVQVEQ